MDRDELKYLTAATSVAEDRIPVTARIDPVHAKALAVLGQRSSRSEIIRRAIAAHLDMTDDARDGLIWNELPEIQLQLLAVINLGKTAVNNGLDGDQFIAFAEGVVRRVVRMLDELERRQ
jgi:hypothetical protein